jgi:hypothetical protein
VIVIIAVTDFVTIFLKKKVDALFLSNVSVCIVRFVRTIKLGLGCNKDG